MLQDTQLTILTLDDELGLMCTNISVKDFNDIIIHCGVYESLHNTENHQLESFGLIN